MRDEYERTPVGVNQRVALAALVHPPTGRRLFAVKTAEEAAEAIAIVRSEPRRHSRWARDIAQEHLDASVVLPRLLREVGVVV